MESEYNLYRDNKHYNRSVAIQLLSDGILNKYELCNMFPDVFKLNEYNKISQLDTDLWINTEAI